MFVALSLFRSGNSDLPGRLAARRLLHEQSLVSIKSLSSCVSLQRKWQAQPPFASQMYERRVAKLQQGATPLYSTPGRNAANENSAVMISFQALPLSEIFPATSEQVLDISLITFTSGAWYRVAHCMPLARAFAIKFVILATNPS